MHRVQAWRERVTAFKTRDAGKGEEFDLMISARGREGWEAKLPTWDAGESLATRKACSATLDAILDVVPGLMGGGADLTGNTGTIAPSRPSAARARSSRRWRATSDRRLSRPRGRFASAGPRRRG